MIAVILAIDFRLMDACGFFTSYSLLYLRNVFITFLLWFTRMFIRTVPLFCYGLNFYAVGNDDK